MIRIEAENLLTEYRGKYVTILDHARRNDYIVWTEEEEDRAISEYTQLREKLIELICG